MSLSKVLHVVTPAEQGTNLITFLSARLGVSRRRAKDLLDRRNVFINDRRIWMARHSLKARDAVAVYLPDPGTPPRTAPDPIVLHEGPGCLVADKPAGLLSNGPDSAESRLREKTGRPTLRAVHRLDRDTSGCLLFAFDDARFDKMVESFRAGLVRKLYHALVAGRISADMTIEKPLEGQTAVTKLHVLDASPEASHVQLKIETGRTHQIRKHLAMVRHPVLGDREYGNAGPQREAFQTIPRQLLHAARLEFPDPDTGNLTRVEAPLPRDFRTALKRLGLT